MPIADFVIGPSSTKLFVLNFSKNELIDIFGNIFFNLSSKIFEVGISTIFLSISISLFDEIFFG